MSSELIYFFTVLENLKYIATIMIPFGLLSFVAILIAGLVYTRGEKDENLLVENKDHLSPEDKVRLQIHHKCISSCKKILISILILLLIGSFIPTKREVAAIYTIPKIINNKQVQDIPKKTLELTNQWLEEQIKNNNQER